MFFPLSITIYWLLPKNGRSFAFISFSVIFLGMTDLISAVCMLLLTAMTAGFGKLSDRLRRKRLVFILLTVLLMLLYAVCFILWSYYSSEKYSHANSFLRYCPVGMAFFFLQGTRFAADVLGGRITASDRLRDTVGYLLFYPRLAMGPIQSYGEHRIMVRDAVTCSERLGEGLGLFVLGLSKKILLADTIGLVFNEMYYSDDRLSFVMSWIKVLAFALQFYFTVSGYGNMAKGIALCYGFRLPDSYGKPMLSGSLARFGTEWNISVVSWCRACFMPLFRSHGLKYALGTVLAWVLLGFWYDPVPHMALWGLWMGAWIGLHQYIIHRQWRIPSVVHAFVFIIVTFFAWAFFSADSLSGGMAQLMQLMGSGKSFIQHEDFYFIRSGGIILLIALYSATDSFQRLMKRIKSVPSLSRICEILTLPVQLILLLLCIAVLATHIDVSALQWKGVLI